MNPVRCGNIFPIMMNTETLHTRCIAATIFLLALTAARSSVAQDAPPSAQDTAESQTDDAHERSPANGEAKRTLDLSNPRATMRTFLVAIQNADADQPERIDDAVQCMDTTEIEDEGRGERARSLARRLHAVIDGVGVKLDDIPTDSEREFVFHIVEGSDGPRPAIRLTPNPDSGQWRFTTLTLASIPALEESLKATEPAKPDTNAEVPAARRSPRATMETFLNAMNADPADLDEAIMCFDPTGRDQEAWGAQGNALARKLKNVMDKIKLVVLSEIPESADGEPYVWCSGEKGNIVIGRIAEVDAALKPDWRFTPKKNEWRFTPQTTDTLDALYKEYEDRTIIRELQDAGVQEELTLGLRLQRLMPTWLRHEYFHLQGWQWSALAALLPLGWVIKIFAGGIATLMLRLWLRSKKFDIDRDKQSRAMGSFGAVAAVLAWYIAIHQLELPAGLFGVLFRATQLAFAVTAVWAGYRVVDVLGGYIASNKDVRLTQMDEVLIPLLSKILRMLVVLVVVLIVLNWAGYEPTTVFGVLGIGGMALAFASQDTLGNFFGSITVLFDRPFGIGDWIVIGDIEGTVERVGFRSTRVRTFYNSVVTIPNSKMVNSHVDNYGARQFRRVRIMLSITYATPPERIDAFCEGIRELIRLHPYTRKDYYHVYFNQFAASSLDILLYTFFEVPDWGTELRERHRLFVDIMRLAERLGVEFAYPTQTLWIERDKGESAAVRGVSIAPGEDDPDTIGVDTAAKTFADAYGETKGLRAPVVIDTIPRSRRARQTNSGDSTDAT